MKILRQNWIITAALLAIPSALFADTLGFSIASANNELYQIDLSNGMATSLGIINTDSVLGGVAATSSRLYAVSTSNGGASPSQLYDITTAPGVLVGDTGPRLGSTTGALYLPKDGGIYDLQGMPSLTPGVTQSFIYKIDPNTGASTLQGSSPIYANGLALSPAGVGYATDFLQNGALYRVALDPFTLTLVGNFGLGIGGTGFNSGAAFDSSGTLYVLREDGAIFTVATSGPNPGAATFETFVTDSATMMPFTSSLEGLAVYSATTSPVPEPGSLFLVAPAMLMLGFFLRKRLQAP